MGPFIDKATSDQPILELLVRSTMHIISTFRLEALEMKDDLTLILIPVSNISKVENSSVVVVLTREDDVVDISRVSICNWMGCTSVLAGLFDQVIV